MAVFIHLEIAFYAPRCAIHKQSVSIFELYIRTVSGLNHLSVNKTNWVAHKKKIAYNLAKQTKNKEREKS